MLKEAFTIESLKDSMISLRVVPGHFTTCNSHFSHYLDMSTLKTNVQIAQDVARELAVSYLGNSDIIDTIVCMEGTEMIGAFLAQELLMEGTVVMNGSGNLSVLTPIYNKNGQLVFQHNEYDRIDRKNTILLVATVAGGTTVSRAIECLEYYGGNLIGISALFSAVSEVCGQEIEALFTPNDIPGYRFSLPSDCKLCKEGKPLEAIINCSGYTEFQSGGK